MSRTTKRISTKIPKKSKRFELAEKLIVELAKGNFSFRQSYIDADDELNAIVQGLNLLGAELQHTVNSTNYLNSVLEGIRSALFILDRHYQVHYSNSFALELIPKLNNRYSRDKGGFTPSFLQYIGLQREQIIIAAQKGEPIAITIIKNEKPVYLLLHFSELSGNSHLAEGKFICFIQDISAIKLQEKQLANTQKELQSLMYHITHELRTPVVNLIGIIQLMDEATKAQQAQEEQTLLKLAEQSVYKLDKMIRNLNMIIELQNENEVASEDFHQLLRSAFNQTQNLFPQSNIRLENTVDKGFHLMLSNNFINQMLSNLFFNCFQYVDTSKKINKVQVSLNLENDFYHLEIKDNGIGIEEQVIGKINNPFFKGSAQSSGSGTSLYSIHKTLEQMGGYMLVNSVFNKYTSITLAFPKKLIAKINDRKGLKS